MKRLLIALFAAIVSLAPLQAQVVHLAPSRAPRSELALGSLSLSATPSTVNFTLLPGAQTQGSAAVSVVTVANLSAVSSLSVYASFSSAAALTTSAGDTLPSSAVFGRSPTGANTAYAPFTQTTPFSSANGLLLYRSVNLVSLGGSRTDLLYLMIDLSSIPQLAAGNYTGVLTLQAQAL